ncbi:hypothetical protein WDW86_06165 [Bdellovibrionota bacterium FG-2]
MKNYKHVLGLLAFIVLVSGSAFAGEGKFSGLVFGDAYWFAKDHDTTTSLASEKGYQGQNGFWLRRAYFTYDYGFEENWSSRLRFEMNGKDFTDKTGSTISPFLKDLYLQYKWDSRKVFMGLAGTPTLDVVENHWGLRAVEKSPEDLWGLAPSRDLGVAIKGSYSDGLLGYHVMAANGSSTTQEINKGKRVYLSLTSAPIKEVLLEVYGDYESNTHSTLNHVFAGYKVDAFRVGAMFAHRKVAASKNLFNSYNVWSLHAVAKVMDELSAFARVDALDKACLGDSTYLHQSKTAKPMLYIAGVDYEAAKNIHFMPNVEMVTYPEGTDADVIPRITFSWTF